MPKGFVDEMEGLSFHRPLVIIGIFLRIQSSRNTEDGLGVLLGTGFGLVLRSLAGIVQLGHGLMGHRLEISNLEMRTSFHVL